VPHDRLVFEPTAAYNAQWNDTAALVLVAIRDVAHFKSFRA